MGWKQQPQLTKLQQEKLKNKKTQALKVDVSSRPFFTYFNTKKKKCEIETPRITGSNAILDKDL